MFGLFCWLLEMYSSSRLIMMCSRRGDSIVDNFNFVVAYELYEMEGELIYHSPCPMYGTMEDARKEHMLAYKFDPDKDWNIYKLVKTHYA